MGLSLYEISREMEKFEEIYMSCIDDETGEITDSDTLALLEREMETMLVKKGEGIVKYFINKKAEIKLVKEEEERLKKIRQASEKKLNNFENYILINMTKIGIKKIETPVGNISTRVSKQTVVNENMCPHDTRFWSQEVTDKFDKKTIKALIDNGEEIIGATIVENTTVNIK